MIQFVNPEVLEQIKFQYELADWKNLPIVMESTYVPDANLDKKAACLRVFTDHNYLPLLSITDDPGWLLECHCGDRKMDYKAERAYMHNGHETTTWREILHPTTFHCHNEPPGTFQLCYGVMQEVLAVEYCHHCQVIVYSNMSHECSRCKEEDYMGYDGGMSDYEYKQFVKEFVYNKLKGVSI